MRNIFILALVVFFGTINAFASMKYRGIVYDVGLHYNPESLSVESFRPEVVEYDMNVISNILRCNAVRIEGEDIDRLSRASEIAARAGLKIFFNPWKMGAPADSVIPYMAEAAKAAEKLRDNGVDITFVAGCEYSLFNPGIFEGNSVGERTQSLQNVLIKIFQNASHPEIQKEEYDAIGQKLNPVLSNVAEAVRANFNGPVTYSSGTWEPVDWDLFDIVGIDYYRDTQTEQEYVDGLQRYFAIGKPVWVMEVGCCAFEGASKLGAGAFAVCLGEDEEGNGIYVGGAPPKRSEREQADYDEEQIRLLESTGIEGLFIFEFAFPISPYRENGRDADLTAFPIVRSYPLDDSRSQRLPAWEPKEAFYRIGTVYRELEQKKNELN